MEPNRTPSSVKGFVPGRSKPLLEEVLKYQNRTVVEAFSFSYGVSLEESQKIFTELLKYLWLTSKVMDEEAPKSVGGIDPAIAIIDEMWHLFVLHTKDYCEFCIKVMGYFIHHLPTPAGEKANQKRLKDLSESELSALADSRREKYSAIYDLLGHDSFNRWYREFPEKYTFDIIREMRSKSI